MEAKDDDGSEPCALSLLRDRDVLFFRHNKILVVSKGVNNRQSFYRQGIWHVAKDIVRLGLSQ